MGRRIEKMPNPGSIQAGQTSTVTLPLGPTYHRLNIRMMAAATGNAAVNVAAADWGSYIGEIRLLVNGDERIKIDAADLVKLNQFNGQTLVDGVLPLFLSMPWARTIGGEDELAYGTAAGVASFTLELDLKAGNDFGLFEVYAVQDTPRAFGAHLVIQSFGDNFTLTGKHSVSHIWRGVYNMLGIHITSDQIDDIEVYADNVRIYDTDKVIRDATSAVIDRNPQLGMSHIDFLSENRLSGWQPMALQDFRVEMDFTAAPNSYKIYTVSAQGVG